MTPLIQRSTFAKVLCKNCANSFMGIVALHSDFYYLVHSKKSTLLWSPPTQRGQNRFWIGNQTYVRYMIFLIWLRIVLKLYIAKYILLVYDRNHYFGLGPIQKPKPKLADTFRQYHNIKSPLNQIFC